MKAAVILALLLSCLICNAQKDTFDFGFLDECVFPSRFGATFKSISEVTCLPDTVRKAFQMTEAYYMYADRDLMAAPSGSSKIDFLVMTKTSDGVYLSPSGSSYGSTVITYIDYKVSNNLNYHFLINTSDSLVHVCFIKHQYGEDGDVYYQTAEKQKNFIDVNYPCFIAQLANGFEIYLWGYQKVYAIVTSNKNKLLFGDYRLEK